MDHAPAEYCSVPVVLDGRALPFKPITVTESVMAVVPEEVPVASPAIVKRMFWLPEIHDTASDTLPLEFAEVTQPWPVKEVTPVFVTVVVEFVDPATVLTDSPVPPTIV
jgi:hypothetical protein